MNDTRTDRPANFRSKLPAYGRTPKELLRDPEISVNAKALYAMMDEVAGHEQLTMDKLGSWLGTSGQTARRAVRELQNAGWVEIIERFVEGRQLSNEYVCNAYPHQADEDSGVTPRPITRDSPPPITSDSPRGVTSDRASTETFRDEVHETNNIALFDTDQTPQRPPDPDLLLHFEEFWDAYPRKTAKGQARKAWPAAVKKTDPETIVKAAMRYRDDPNRAKQFTKHPATWLNGECWEDEPLPTRDQNGHSSQDEGRVFGYWREFNPNPA